MENKKFNRACELDEKIRKIKYEIKLWEGSGKMGETIELVCFGSSLLSVSSEYIDFKALKARTLFTLEKKLRELEDEFNEL